MKGLIALSLAACAAAAPAFHHETIHGDAAPILSASNAEVIPNSYIIKFKEHVTDAGASDHHSWVQEIHGAREDERLELRKRSQIPLVDDVFRGLKHTYKIGENFLGYSGHFDDAVIEQVRRHPDVGTNRFLPTLHTGCCPPAISIPVHPFTNQYSIRLSTLRGTQWSTLWRSTKKTSVMAQPKKWPLGA